MRPLRQAFLHGALALGLAGACAGAQAQAWPSKPIKVVVPFAAGGVTDLVTREVTARLKDRVGATFVIENRPGAGGNLGATAVATAAPDGHTLLAGTLSTYALNAGLYDRLGHDPQKQLTPIALTAMVPIVIVVNPALGVRDLSSFIALLKANPDKYNYGSAGPGTSSHVALAMFLEQTGTRAQHVPYKGTAAVLTDLVANNVSFAVVSPVSLGGFVQDGKLIPLAAVSPRRLKALPQVPTVEEAGLRHFEAYSWNGLFAPAGTPPAILDRLHEAVEKTMQDPALMARFEEQGTLPMPSPSRAAVEKFVKAEYQRWVPYVRKMGLKAE